MPGFLGYHPDRVLQLRRALAASLDDARSLTCDDPLAVEATARWRRAVVVLAAWEPRLATILGCAFDSPYRRVLADVDLPIDYLRPHDRAWTVVNDPLAGPLPTIDPLARVDEVVALLAVLDGELLGDPDACRRLSQILALIFGDDAARRRLVAEIDPDAFAEVVDRSAREAVAGDGPDSARLLLETLAAGLGWAVTRGDIDESAYRAALVDGAHGDAHTAALVLRAARFPTPVVVSWAVQVLDRSLSVAPGGLGVFATEPGQGTGDLVLAALTADPEAGREVFLRLAELNGLDALLGPHLDGDARGRFLLAIVDPQRFDVASTLPILDRLLGVLGDHHDLATTLVDGRDLHDWLGAVVGPYLLDLLPGACHACVRWGDHDALDVLWWIAESERAAASLSLWLSTLSRRAIAALAGRRGEAADRLAASLEQISLVMDVVARAQIARAADLHDRYELLVGSVRFVLGTVMGGISMTLFGNPGMVAAPVVDKGTGQLVEWGFDGLDAVDWFDEPPTAQQVAQVIARRAGAWQAGMVADALGALRDNGVAGGTIPPNADPPPRPLDTDDAESYAIRIAQWAGHRAHGAPFSALATDVATSVALGVSAARRVHPGEGPFPDLAPPHR